MSSGAASQGGTVADRGGCNSCSGGTSNRRASYQHSCTCTRLDLQSFTLVAALGLFGPFDKLFPIFAGFNPGTE